MDEVEKSGLMQQALGMHQRGQIEAAMALYQVVLDAEPAHGGALHLLGVALRQRGRAHEAVDLIARALVGYPHHAAAHCNLGAALQDLGRTEEALASYERALALRPEYPMALANSGNALRRLGRVEAAIVRYEAALKVQPEYPEALANLGVALQLQGRDEEALRALARALELRPRLAEAWCARGAVLQKRGLHDEARTSYERVLDCDPRHVDTLSNLATLAQQERAYDAALGWAMRALDVDASHAPAHLQRANALRALGDTARALDAYRAARAHGADPALADFMIASLDGTAVPSAPPPQYVAALFDQYAADFDEHLQHALDYDTPQLLVDALRPYLDGARTGAAVPPAGAAAALHANLPGATTTEKPPARIATSDILDAGCGTGLCGPLLRPFARHLSGVDLSPAMLERARARHVYDDLACAELVACLSASPARFDAIVAADVLVYLGALEPLFAAAARALRPGGIFAFSVEHGAGNGYTLQPTGRYAHADDYIAALPGFETLSATPAVIRRERGADVHGRLYVLRRTVAPSAFLTASTHLPLTPLN